MRGESSETALFTSDVGELIMTGTTTGEHLIQLNSTEREQLLAILHERLKTLQVEIHRTDALTYREVLNREEALLVRLIEKVTALGE